MLMYGIDYKENDMDAKINNAVMRQLMALTKMSVVELQNKWRDLYGVEPPEVRHSFLVKRLAYRIQELYYGGLDAETLTKLKGDIKPNKKGQPLIIGSKILKIYKGVQYEVTVCENGFEYKGEKYRSLSAVAGKITGSHLNGKTFFGVK